MSIVYGEKDMADKELELKKFKDLFLSNLRPTHHIYYIIII